MKKILCLVLAFCMVFAFAACGKEAEENVDDTPTYIALTEATYPPFESYDENNNLVGFDIDMIEYIAKDQGFKVEWLDIAFDSLIPALQSDQGDIIAAGFIATPERKEQVDFTSEYRTGKYGFIVDANNDDFNSINDLKPDMVVASQIGTQECERALELKEEGKIKDVVILDNFVTCVMQTINGDVDATVTSIVTANAYIEKFPGKIKMVEDSKSYSEGPGFAVKKGNTELLEKLETGLQNLIADGTYEDLLAKWGLQ